MSDGAVSIAGLVFGVAASTNDSHIVLLAGAAGAVAGAVSMMAGTYLDVQSSEDRARARTAALEARVRANPRDSLDVMRQQLERAGFEDDEIDVVDRALSRNPDSVVRFTAIMAGNVRPSGESPIIHAAWMFVADIVAASVPVLPFALLDIATARFVSLGVTTVLLVVLGLGRARIAHRSVLEVVAETLVVAGTAALAGVLIGRFVAG